MLTVGDAVGRPEGIGVGLGVGRGVITGSMDMLPKFISIINFLMSMPSRSVSGMKYF